MTDDAISDLKARNAHEAEALLAHGIPARIIALTDLKQRLRERRGSTTSYNPVELLRHPSVSTNADVLELFLLVKGEVLSLVEDLGVLRLFIRLGRPAVADEGFNSSVQDEILQIISQSRSAGLMVVKQIAKYFVSRAHIVTKCLKYPGCEDMRNTLVELDRIQHSNLVDGVGGIRDSYLLLLDKIQKNRHRLREAAEAPRSSAGMIF